MHVKYRLTGCEDCIAYVVNGNIPEDRPTLATEIADHLGAEDIRHLVNAGDPEDNPTGEDWFSWSPCECCGSPLGGMRNHLAVLAD